MYYLLYTILYLMSLLPFRMLYVLSDVAFFILYHIVGYRKKIVYNNLDIAFPEKTPAEKKVIMKKFYRNLTDTFIETIKLLSISDRTFDKHISIDVKALNALADKGISIQVHSGHQMNWEYAHLAFARHVKVPWIGVYMQIKNPAMNRLFLKIRSKYHAVMLAAGDFKKSIRNYYSSQYMLALIADQNPGIPKNAQWLYFFNRPAPFLGGPEIGAIRNKTALVFVNFVKTARGYYRFEPTIITEDASDMKDGELTLLYRDFLENSIRLQPDNYLWSHRRWKIPYNSLYAKRWIDPKEAPVS